MSAVLVVIVCAGAAIGALAGFFRKFTKTSFWGLTAVLALLFERVIGSSVKKSGSGYGLAVILTTVIVLCILSILFITLKKLLQKAVDSRIRYSEYQNHDDREENEELILNAVDSGDRHAYRKLLKKNKKIKDSAGIWGAIDRICGAVSGCANALFGLGTVVVALLLFVDLSGISALQNAFSSPLSSASWEGLGTALALDLPLVCALSLSVRIGFKGGLTSAISIFVVLGLVAVFAVASWSIASSEACAGAVEGLKNGMLSGLAGTLGKATDTVAKAVIAVIIFALSLVIVILVAVFLPKLIERFRESAIFSTIDGVLGAIALCAVVTALLLAFGGVAYTLNDLPFMEKFGDYATESCLGDAIYAYNPIGSAFNNLPIRGWFKN